MAEIVSLFQRKFGYVEGKTVFFLYVDPDSSYGICEGELSGLRWLETRKGQKQLRALIVTKSVDGSLITTALVSLPSLLELNDGLKDLLETGKGEISLNNKAIKEHLEGCGKYLKRKSAQISQLTTGDKEP